MKRFLAGVSLCVLLLAAGPVHALPLIVGKVAENRDFFAEFAGYSNCYLYDVSRIDEARVGLIVLSPLGFEVRLVWDTRMNGGEGEEVYKDMFVPEKSKRTAMMQESIRVADAVKLAQSMVAHERKGGRD